MTDKESLLQYRLAQAEETLIDAERMLASNISPRSVINRAYYSAFYALLALFIKSDIDLKTSRHAGVICLFDKEFIHSGRLAPQYSKTVHKLFEFRQECDCKEFVSLTDLDARECVVLAGQLYDALKALLEEQHDTSPNTQVS